MDSPLLIGWQQEKAELQQEVSGLQEELVETRAEKEELQSRSRALQERVRLGVKGHMIVTQHSAFVISTAPPPPSLSLPALPVNLCPARPLCAAGGGAAPVEEEAEGGQGEGGATGAAAAPPAQQGEQHPAGGAVPTGPNWSQLVQTGPLVSPADAVVSTVCAGVGLQAAVSAPGAAAAD